MFLLSDCPRCLSCHASHQMPIDGSGTLLAFEQSPDQIVDIYRDLAPKIFVGSFLRSSSPFHARYSESARSRIFRDFAEHRTFEDLKRCATTYRPSWLGFGNHAWSYIYHMRSIIAILIYSHQSIVCDPLHFVLLCRVRVAYHLLSTGRRC